MNITQAQLDAMCAEIERYKAIAYFSGVSWQYYAGLSGVGDITLIADNALRLAHVNDVAWQRSAEGQFLIDATKGQVE